MSASVAALEDSERLEAEICEIFKSRCTSMTAELSRSKNLAVRRAMATFYLFVDISKTGLTSEKFAYRLPEEKHIAVVPGNAFNKAGDGKSCG